LTSNRADCNSHLGVSREIAAIQNSKLKVKNFEIKNTSGNIEQLSSVIVEDTELCPRYTARLIRGVKVAPSPDWLVKRLEAVGERSINNIADITNYVMHELGQPLHAFDFEKLSGKRIVVRRAEKGEKMTTLDAVEREFDENMLLICDAEKPVAIGGVMGGMDSGISDQTVDVLIEAAFFKRENIRQTSRKLGLATEASYRFERGTDIENVLRASNRCVELICEIAGGTATENAIDVYPNPVEEIVIPFRPARVEALTGLKVEPEKMLPILTALGFEMREDAAMESIVFAAPTWRHDMEREEDLVEEIARQIGYDQIAEELPPAFGAGSYQPNEKRKKAVRQSLSDLGLNEAISYSFIDTKHDDEFELLPDLVDEFIEGSNTTKFVTLRDSIIEGAVRMRPTLLPGLLGALRENFNQGSRNVQLFEIGTVFAAFGGSGELPTEKEAFAIVMTGGASLANRAEAARELDFYDLKGALESAVEAMNLPGLNFAAARVKHLRDGQAAVVFLGGEQIGSVGRLSDAVAANYKFKQAVFVAEVDLQKLLATTSQPVLYQPLSRFPNISRDISLLIKRSVTFGEITDFIASEKPEFWQSIEFVDVYQGKGIADDERSLTIRLEYRALDRTLREEEAEYSHNAILTALEKRFAVKLRF
ncbi:MAG: phenylalanine--tRNA ligase subunit beta, partial [Pyrinomonadaceae bacterium]